VAGEREKRRGISEVAELTGVPDYTLRQWEKRFPQLRPSRTRAGRRYYTARDIDVVRQIKYLLRHEGMSAEGVRKQLSLILRGEGRPRTSQEAVDLVDAIEREAREALELLDRKGVDRGLEDEF
jgi:DNA-binding transcriptional MerR regulator